MGSIRHDAIVICLNDAIIVVLFAVAVKTVNHHRHVRAECVDKVKR